jgi:hypothetical protein
MRYRDKMMVRTGMIEAGTIERAAELGKEYCAGKSYKYLGMEDQVLVREGKEVVKETPVPVKKVEVERKVG